MKRLLLHVPVGIFNAWLFTVLVHFGWAFLLLFVVYELNEDKRIKDSAYKDIIGWLYGFAL